MQPVLTRIHRGLAWLVLAGLVLEVYLVGAALFGVTTFEPHRALGGALAVAILLLLVLAPVARRGRRVLGLAALLAALAVVQVLLPSLRTGLPWVAAPHALDALALLGVTAAIARAPGGTARTSRSTDAPAAAGGPEPSTHLPLVSGRTPTGRAFLQEGR
jgi:hypothetical protein